MNANVDKFVAVVRYGAVILGCTLAPMGAAQATLMGTSVTASLNSPLDGVSASDQVTVTNGIEIQAGDGSNIGNFMFTSTSPAGADVPEFIGFFDTGVILRLAGADPNGTGLTGYAAGAEYVFTGLSPTITGINSILLSSNISNFSSTAQLAGCTAGICFDAAADSLTVFLDQITMGPDGNLPAPMGLVTINLSTQTITPPPAVPEPATLSLLAASLIGLGVARRKSSR